jgi:magnesium chelatase subunit D
MTDADARQDDAALAAALFAVDPVGTGGVLVRALPGRLRDLFLARAHAWLPPSAPFRRLPLHAGDARLLGGLDLAATLRAGRPVAERGVLACVDGGVLVLAMAERITPSTAARLTAALDTGMVVVERDGMTLRHPAAIGLVALDEGLAADERTPPALCERLAFHLDLDALDPRADLPAGPDPERIAAARARLAEVATDEATVRALCGTAMALGIASLRASLLALKAARCNAALAGRRRTEAADAEVAARLVLAPRAVRWPQTEPDDSPSPSQPPDGAPEAGSEGPPDRGAAGEAGVGGDRSVEDIVLAAAKSAIQPGLLARLAAAAGASPTGTAGRAGAAQAAAKRGQPIGARRGDVRGGGRLNIVETLRAAAPWQPLRRQETSRAPTRRATGRLDIRTEDLRITRFKQPSETATVFVVDASGSSALHRLAEAKGAVELLLADCYIRRDQVALLTFRGEGADLVLPPTRSLARAKRCLAGLPGGGGTPLAAAIEAATQLARALDRRGRTPTIVFMTDGRANVARDGAPGRTRAETDAEAAGRALRASGVRTLLVDTSTRPQPVGQRLAVAMGACYIPLPYAGAAELTLAVRDAGS